LLVKATLQTTLAGDTHFGSITTTGKATLDGTLAIQLSHDTPPVNQTFVLVNAGSITHQFATIMVTPPTGETFTPTYTPWSLTVQRTS
jgi:hypothetical protein